MSIAGRGRRIFRASRSRRLRDTALVMSRENVEAVRRGYDHFNRTHEPVYELMAPDIAWHTAVDLPDTGTHRGHEGVAALFSEWAASFDDFRADPHELIDAGEYVVAWCTLRGRARGARRPPRPRLRSSAVARTCRGSRSP
jgi:ketosteroid isomerase-like protein